MPPTNRRKVKEERARIKASAPVVRKTSTSKASRKNGRRPWDRLSDESTSAFAAFEVFRNIPKFKRNLQAVARQTRASTPESGVVPTSDEASIARWYRDHRWLERVEAYDRYMLAEAHEKAVQALAEELIAQSQVGKMIYARAADALHRKSPEWWDRLSPKELKDMVALGTTLSMQASERLVDLTVARIDADVPTIEFDLGSAQEAVFEALLRGDWQSVQYLTQRLMVATAERHTQPSAEKRLSSHQKERVRSFTNLLLKAVSAASEPGEDDDEGKGGNGNGGNGGGGAPGDSGYRPPGNFDAKVDDNGLGIDVQPVERLPFDISFEVPAGVDR